MSVKIPFVRMLISYTANVQLSGVGTICTEMNHSLQHRFLNIEKKR